MNQKLTAAVAAFAIFAALTAVQNPNPPVNAPKFASGGDRPHQATYPLGNASNALQRDSEALARVSARLAVLAELENARFAFSDFGLKSENAQPEDFSLKSSDAQSDPWRLMSDAERLESVVLEPED